jgi:hypothetical protein
MDKTLLGLMMLFFLAFTIFMTFVVFNQQLTSVTRASTETIAVEKSLIFAWPLTVKADGETASQITVFIRNEEGKGVAEKTVRLETTVGQVREPSVVTDKSGKATFRVVSSEQGLAEIRFIVDNSRIDRPVTVEFE